MNIVMVEDSRLARNELRELMKRFPEHRIVGEAENVAEGIALIDAERPDLVLLDIQLPDGDGFSLLEKIEHVPQVVFTTAYDEHALAAFAVNALDYLLKPIEHERLAQSLARAAKASEPVPHGRAKKSRDDQIFIRDGERCFFVRLTDVYFCEVEGNYTRVYFSNQKALLSRSLGYLAEHLDEQIFFRANRQQLVNLDFVESVEPWVNEGLLLKLKQGMEVEVSRRQTKLLRDLMAL
ncbi:MAG: LytTR family DNA-binding domain-containing protein [Cellvibrionaceae bacterium]